MLRREFIKSTTLAVGGIVLAGNIVLAGEKRVILKPRKIPSRNLRLKGIGKNGCSTPPHFQNMMATGHMNIGWK
ncbi:MAG: hypothetical protein ABIJ45_15075 [Candidatus Zixiibacteriota bacterium]